jgi:23S rRNA pseudouridine2605 synthase
LKPPPPFRCDERVSLRFLFIHFASADRFFRVLIGMNGRGWTFAFRVAGSKTRGSSLTLWKGTVLMIMISSRQCLSFSLRYGVTRLSVPPPQNLTRLHTTTARASHVVSSRPSGSYISFPSSWALSAVADPSSNNSFSSTAAASASPANKTKYVDQKKSGSKLKTYRADRVLSNRGWASRADCFQILKQKRVFMKIQQSTRSEGDTNNEKDTTTTMIRIMGPSEQIPMDASLWVDGTTEVGAPSPLLRVYHKPKWVLSVMGDPQGRPNLESLDMVHQNTQLHPVGRLDYDTSGLLLFSSEGPLTQALLHPTHGIQKEYVAVVVGQVDEEDLRQKLQQGVTTSMGAFPAKVVEACSIDKEDVPRIIADILNNLPPEYDVTKLEEKGYLFFKDATNLSQVRLVVEEGKHRMVRRILANSGHAVVSLKRERLGVIQLGDLKEGQHRELTDEEETWARNLITTPKKKKAPPPSRKKAEVNSDKRNKK